MPRPRPPRAALAALATVTSLALLPLTACGSDDAEGPRVVGSGEVVAARQVQVDDTGRAPFLLVPSGRLEVRAGEPLDALSADQTRSREAVTAPQGSVFVPVTWTYRSDALASVQSVFGQRQPLTVTLTSDDRDYRLVAPAEDRSASDEEEFYVAVEGDGSDVRLEAEYAGVTQGLDLRTGEREAGVARRLYGLQDLAIRNSECGDRDWVDDDAPLAQLYFYCTTTTAVVTPFADGAWAEPGHVFVLVGVTSTVEGYLLPSADGFSSATYAAVSSRDTTTLGGREPVSSETVQRSPGTVTDFLTFDVEGRVPDELRVGRRIELTLDRSLGFADAPDTLRVTARGEVPLG